MNATARRRAVAGVPLNHPIEARDLMLASVYARAFDVKDWIFELKTDGFREQVLEIGFEGMVAKRHRSSCRAGRSRDWLKIKNPRYHRSAAIGLRQST
jgi:ATP-dependent DNA ligase